VNAQHTPGPWTIEISMSQYGNYSILEAMDEDFFKEDEVNDKTDKANARLIAAAPDMLEALELAKAMGFGGEHPDECYEPVNIVPAGYAKYSGPLDCQCGLAIVQAAIDKAKGIAFDCVDGEHGCYSADQPCGCPCDNCRDDTEFRCKVCNTLIDTQMSAMLTSRSLEICEDCQGGE